MVIRSAITEMSRSDSKVNESWTEMRGLPAEPSSIHTYIHNKSYSAQSYIKTERLCITKVQTYTK